jgi:hypothetical protein
MGCKQNQGKDYENPEVLNEMDRAAFQIGACRRVNIITVE